MDGQRMLEKRNWTFDYLKGIACIIVVFLHCPLYGKVGEAVIYGLRFPVPIFFMISGFYLEKRDNRWILGKIKKLLLILVITELLYGAWFFISSMLLKNMSFGQALDSAGFINHPVRTFFCGSLFNGTLWYIYAIIWTYVIILLLRKIKLYYNTVFCLIISMILIIVLVAGRFYVTKHYNIDELAFLFGNAVTMGLPLTLPGVLFGRKKELIQEKMTLKRSVLLIMTGAALMVVEFIVWGQYMDFHFSTLFISVGLFCGAIVYKKETFPGKSLFSFIGRKLSMWVYLDHWFFKKVFDEIELYVPENLQTGFSIMKPIVVCLLAILFAIVLNKLLAKKKINKASGQTKLI